MEQKKYTVLSLVSLVAATALIIAALFIPCYEKEAPYPVADYDGQDDLILGLNDFLFRAYGKNSSELAEFKGEGLFSEKEINSVITSLSEMKNTLSFYGSDCVFVLVPSKLSLYRDMLPENLKNEMADERRYTQILKALEGSGLDFVDLTRPLEAASENAQIYNTASDTLSDLGGYYVYKEVLSHLNEKYQAGLRISDFNEYVLSLEYEDGYELAKEYNQRHGTDIKNRSYKMTPLNDVYTQGEYDFENTLHTRVPYMNRDKGYSYPSALVCEGGGMDSAGKFFSPSFSSLVFRNGLVADETVISLSRPEYGVFLISEGCLYSLAAASGGLEGDESGITVTPEIADCTHSGKDSYVIFGSAEPGSVITVRGGQTTVSTETDSGLFAVECKLASGLNTLVLTAKAEGKKESASVTLTAAPDNHAGNKQVVVGKNGHLHYEYTLDDYRGTNLFDEGTLQYYKKMLEEKLEYIHSVSPNTELIYVIAPNHLTVYPETAPDWLQAQKASDISRIDQLHSVFASSPVTFIDLREALSEAKENSPYRLYNKTDTHWNELGAYYASCEILSYIAEKYPAAAPESLDSYHVFTRFVPGGDMASFLGVDLNRVKEEGVFVRYKGQLHSGINKDYTMNFENAWFSDRHVFTIDDDSLPTMVMYRDSFTTNMMSFLAEKFSYSHFTPMSDNYFDIELIKEIQPDYIIVEIVERNLGVLY